MPTENTTTQDAMRLKWIEHRKVKAQREAEKQDYKLWLAKQTRHKQYKAQMEDFDLAIRRLERGMDECASLGEQGDFAVDLEPGYDGPQVIPPAAASSPPG